MLQKSIISIELIGAEQSRDYEWFDEKINGGQTYICHLISQFCELHFTVEDMNKKLEGAIRKA